MKFVKQNQIVDAKQSYDIFLQHHSKNDYELIYSIVPKLNVTYESLNNLGNFRKDEFEKFEENFQNQDYIAIINLKY